MAIDIVTLAEVKMECERVLACLRRVQKECVKKDDDGKPFMPYMAGAVDTAALKRASKGTSDGADHCASVVNGATG